MTFDPDAFSERAAIMEYDAGMTRFQAETEAARAQGLHRWEAIRDVARRIVDGLESAKREGRENADC